MWWLSLKYRNFDISHYDIGVLIRSRRTQASGQVFCDAAREQAHNVQNTPSPRSTIHHFRTEMCTFPFHVVFCGIWGRCIVGFFRSVSSMCMGNQAWVTQSNIFFQNYQVSGYLLNITNIADRCRHILVAMTPIIYECNLKNLTWEYVTSITEKLTNGVWWYDNNSKANLWTAMHRKLHIIYGTKCLVTSPD